MAMFQAQEQHEEGVDTVINVTDRLISSTGDAHEMVKQAKYLAQVSHSYPMKQETAYMPTVTVSYTHLTLPTNAEV